jgi:predicted transcriptional regulator
MLTGSQRNLLNLIANDRVFTDQCGGSLYYRKNKALIAEMVSLGLVRQVDGICCRRKYFILTAEGQGILKRGEIWHE